MLNQIRIPAPLVQFWQQREPREQNALIAAVIILALVFLDLGIVSPLFKEKARLQNSLPSLRLDVARFQRDLIQINGHDQQHQDLPAELRLLASSSGMSPDVLSIASSDTRSGKLVAHEADWNALLALLDRLQKRGIKITLIDAKATSTAGQVDAEVEVSQ